MPQSSPSGIRHFRSDQNASSDHESSAEPERVPFLTQEQTFDHGPTLEDGAFDDPSADAAKSSPVTCSRLGEPSFSFEQAPPQLPTWRSPWTVPLLTRLFGRRRAVVHKEHIVERGSLRKSHCSTPLRRVLRLLALSLMLLGIVEFIALACGLLAAFFPDDLDDEFDGWKPTGRLSRELARWPTDFSADIQPVSCHSHNDYWRKEPLFSALKAGCTGVEADVWLYDQDLYVGHSTASLTPERTLRSLYINPLIKILEQQNPLTPFHPSLDNPRNGVFDTEPTQTLVLLIDFKNEGQAIWPHVSQQLEPLRQKKYLTYFNGSSIVEGPITVVVTGNAPFNAVVANPHYRDIFFDAPLDLMDQLADVASPSGPPTSYDLPPEDYNNSVPDAGSGENQGQGHSGAAPSNPAVYSPANSYYASVSFKSAVGWPWRGRLSRDQIEIIRKQIAGAHARGLKVRYWSVPSWPRGMRNYLWRLLVREGVDYLNVDDLRSATKGHWNWGRKPSWWGGPWKFRPKNSS